MTYHFQQKMGGLLLLGVTALFVGYTVPQFNLLTTGIGVKEWGVALLVYLLAVALLARRHFLLQAVHTDERGLTIVRRGVANLHYPWTSLTVSDRRGERRAAAGLMLERVDKEEPYFLTLGGLGEDEVTALRQELRQRLGDRYVEEELRNRGAGRM